MRNAEIKRKTNETNIELKLNLDGSGKRKIESKIGFFDHMLDLLAKHANFDMEMKIEGDTHVDFHHSVEDAGIVLGQALNDALGSKKGIERYKSLSLPMDETLVDIALDISGRPFLVYNAEGLKTEKTGSFDTELTNDFFHAFCMNAKITLHINLRYGTNSHHIIEAMFKGVGRALREAVKITGNDIPSTKGSL